MGNSSSVIQYGFDMPPPDVSSLTVVGGQAAGNMGTGSGGTYGYQITFVTGFGETPPISQTSGVTGVTVTGSMLLTNIPTLSSGNVTARNIYRTSQGGSFPGAFLATLHDNITTTYTDISSDSSLGSNAPVTNTAGSRTQIAGSVGFSTAPRATTAVITANGIDYTTAPQLPLVEYAIVESASGLNGVLLPTLNNQYGLKGTKIIVNNQGGTGNLNVYPDYTNGDSINSISGPNGWVVSTGTSTTFVAVQSGPFVIWYAC